MSYNARIRKNRKEYARGLAAGEENRIRQPNEWRPNVKAAYGREGQLLSPASTHPYAYGWRDGQAARRRKLIVQGVAPLEAQQ